MKQGLVYLAVLPLSGGCTGRCCAPRELDYYVVVSDVDDGGTPLDQSFTDAGCAAECLRDRDVELVSCTPASGVVHCVALSTHPCSGRRPAALVRAPGRSRDAIGDWLASAAQLEAASAPAFELLARELTAHDAPARLVAAARTAAEDERRHTLLMAGLAARHGARPGPVRVPSHEPRPLESLAHENAVEGLVREAFGARVALLQSLRATDARIAAANASIAVDEQRHADLAAAVDAWIRPQLTGPARRRVDEALELARARLIDDCAVEPPPPLRDTLGLPDATRAVDLARTI
jgi:hypothetical protein